MRFVRSLSGRLLIVTILTVMLAEVAIFLPSVARFRHDYIYDRVRRAELAVFTVMAAPGQMVGPELARTLLDRAEVYNIAVRSEGVRQMVIPGMPPSPLQQTFDLRDAGSVSLVRDALARLTAADSGVIRVVANAPADVGKTLEITLSSRKLQAAMIEYGLNILALSLGITLATAIMVFFAVRAVVVRPMTEVIENLRHFSQNPEDASRIMTADSRVSDIAVAQEAVAEMQRDVHGALKSKARLAALGEAVAKISHDLRNILATTQLMADRLDQSSDPVVERMAPKLIRSLDRAIRLCQSTLAFGKAEEAPPEPRIVDLASLAAEVGESVSLGAQDDAMIEIKLSVADGTYVLADPEHVFRILGNLAKNATEAIRASGRPGGVTLKALSGPDTVEILVEDTGPGLPAKALENLFRPFQGSTRRDGAGLGLAIAHELAAVNGGALELLASTTTGTVFRLVLPAARTARLA